MTCRLVSRQACEDPRKLFNTWLNCLQVKWQWNSQAVNFLYRSRCWECDRPGIKFCQSLLGIFYWGCPMSVCIYGVLSYSLYPCDWVLSIKSSVSISIHLPREYIHARHIGKTLCSHSPCIHPGCLANWINSCLSSQRPPLQCPFAGNGNGLLYCILFMIYIDCFPSALSTVQCHLLTKIQTSIFLSSLFQTIWSIFSAVK